MILDSLKNAELYYSLCPRMKQAFEWLAKTDLMALEVGKHPIDGEDIFINVMERELKTKADAKLEVHNVYADIQVLIKGEKECFGWSERKDLKMPQSDFDTEKDVQLFDDESQTYYTIVSVTFTILKPEGGYAPLDGVGVGEWPTRSGQTH